MSRTMSMRSSAPNRPLPELPSYDASPSPSLSSASPSPFIPPDAARPESAIVISDADQTLLTLAPDLNSPPGVPGPVHMTWAGSTGGLSVDSSLLADSNGSTVSLNSAIDAQAAALARYSMHRHSPSVSSNNLSRQSVYEETINESEALPPSYADARNITEPVSFTFSPVSFNSMLLIPPASHQDTRPLVHISVALNCFNPTSYITTVRQGGSDNGEYMGEFEMGISASKGTVTIGDKHKNITAVLTKSGSKRDMTGTWTWNFTPSGPYLTWEWSGALFSCFTRPKPGHSKPDCIATFSGTSLTGVNLKGQRPPEPKLKLWPRGYAPQMLAHVVISALIIERKRLTPSNGEVKMLFS